MDSTRKTWAATSLRICDRGSNRGAAAINCSDSLRKRSMSLGVTVASPSRLGSVTDALTDGTSGISSTLGSDPDKTLVAALTAATPTLDSVLCPQSCPRRQPDLRLC